MPTYSIRQMGKGWSVGYWSRDSWQAISWTNIEACALSKCDKLNGVGLASPKSTSPNNLQELASELPTRSTQASPWIPIEKSLPGIGVEVLITNDGRWIGVGCLRNGGWHVVHFGPYIGALTHWMPLPDPPEANQEDSVNNTSGPNP